MTLLVLKNYLMSLSKPSLLLLLIILISVSCNSNDYNYQRLSLKSLSFSDSVDYRFQKKLSYKVNINSASQNRLMIINTLKEEKIYYGGMASRPIAKDLIYTVLYKINDDPKTYQIKIDSQTATNELNPMGEDNAEKFIYEKLEEQAVGLLIRRLLVNEI